MQTNPQPASLRERRAARRIATATKRINEAKQHGPEATVNEARACLMSALREVGSDRTVMDRYADRALATIRELYGQGSGS
jgi:hypothetical protein